MTTFQKHFKLPILLIVLFTAISLFADNLDFNFENIISKKKEGNTVILEKKDGTIIKRTPNTDTAIFQDKTVIIKNYQNGIITIKKNDGSKIIENRPKGTRTYISQSGKENVFSFVAKTPYGDPIKKISKPLQRKPIAVDIIYNPQKSDDILDGNTELFFNELYAVLRKKVISRRYEGKLPLKINISHCRFGKFSYCYKKKGELLVVFSDSNKEYKTFKINALKLKDKKFRHNKAIEIYNYFKTL